MGAYRLALCVYIVAYAAFVIIGSSTSLVDLPEIRLLSPVFVPIVLLIGARIQVNKSEGQDVSKTYISINYGDKIPTWKRVEIPFDGQIYTIHPFPFDDRKWTLFTSDGVYTCVLNADDTVTLTKR